MKRNSETAKLERAIPSLVPLPSIAHFVSDVASRLKARHSETIEIDGTDYTPDNLAPSSVAPESFCWHFLDEQFQPKSMDETVQKADGFECHQSDQQSDIEGVIDRQSPGGGANQATYHVKIRLTETDDMILFENASHSVAHDSEEAALVEARNQHFENRSRTRRTTDAEAQTRDLPCKSRSVNTERIQKQNVASFVSNYDMYDTYNDLERHTKEINVAESSSKMEITTYSREGMEDIDDRLNRNQNFHLSSMILQRLLAGNVYREQQIRFRNLYPPDPCRVDVKYLYRLDTLWTFKTVETVGKSVVSASWCSADGDIVAIAYGIYGHTRSDARGNGFVYVWSIKNPVNPERRYQFDCPVTCVAFSPRSPQLLAVGLYDGRLEIRDITDGSQQPLAVSERGHFPVYEPIWDLKWVLFDNADKDEVMAASQNGYIMKYTLNVGQYLLAYPLLRLDRVEGTIEGIAIDRSSVNIQSDLHPQPLCLAIHPVKMDKYYVGTEEGCVHWCCINDPYQHLGVRQMHGRGVFGIEYSPWSPKIFLTCGGDWCIRIWIEDLLEPIVTLSAGFGPIQAAFWSPINSTVIASITRSSVQLWDLKRRSPKPASETTFPDGATALTVLRFTNCGRSLLVGDADGRAHICALEDMPFPPHFQYKELQSAIYKSLVTKPDLLAKVRRAGHLGY